MNNLDLIYGTKMINKEEKNKSNVHSKNNDDTVLIHLSY